MKIVVLTGEETQCNKLSFPAFFSKADSTLLKGGKPFFIPDFAPQCVASVHLVAKVSRLGKGFSKRFAPRYMDAWTLAVCFTAQGTECNTFPSMAVDFDGTTMIGDFEKSEYLDMDNVQCNVVIGTTSLTVSLKGLGEEMLRCLAELSNYFTWRQGDLLFSKPLADVVKVQENDHVTGYMNNKLLLEFNVK